MTTSIAIIIPLFFILFFFPLQVFSVFNVVSFGAKPDGRTDATKPFLAAWMATCGAANAQTLYVPWGRFMLGQIVFMGPCKNSGTTIQIDGTLVAPSNYNALGSSGEWIVFLYVNGLSIFGGTLDGQGGSLWACKAAGRSCPLGAKSLSIGNSKNVVISGLTSINSELFHMFIYSSEFVTVQGGTLIAPAESPNTDGIHVQSSRGVTIRSMAIKTGDDCISVGPGTFNLWIESITCGPGHGISIGSLAQQLVEEGVQNVTVKNVVFSRTDNGLRIKTWGRPSTGFVRGVVFQQVTMDRVNNPIIIDQNYCPTSQGCPNQRSGISITNLLYSNIKGTSATEVAVTLDCSPRAPCQGIRMQDIRLTFGNTPTSQSICNNAKGTASGVITPPNCLR